MVIRVVLVIGLVFVAGCHCGLDTGPLDALRCDEGQPCPAGTTCAGRYCEPGDAGGGPPDAPPDAASDLDAAADAGRDAEAPTDAGPDSAAPCPEPQTDCAGSCTDLQADPDNCGECGNVCAANRVCSAGTCDDRCAAPLEACDRWCVDLLTDADNCGTCGEACNGHCSNGMCCGLNEQRCSNACFDTVVSPDHCGGCGTPCDTPEAPVCVDGACECPDGVDGWVFCTDHCARPQMDHAECGDCGDPACSGGDVCNRGSCQDWCGPGLTNCDGACVDTTADPYHCGACRRQCRAGLVCNDGACAEECERGLTTCDGFCADTDDSEMHCGDCWSPCRGGEVCWDGSCRDPKEG